MREPGVGRAGADEEVGAESCVIKRERKRRKKGEQGALDGDTARVLAFLFRCTGTDLGYPKLLNREGLARTVTC